MKEELEKIYKFAEMLYKEGYEEGKKELARERESEYQRGLNDALGDKTSVKKAYNNGLYDAWEAARKLFSYVEDGGFAGAQIREIFGEPTMSRSEIFNYYSVDEVIKKIKEYESHLPDKDVGEIKGLFIPNITAEMFRNGCLESIEALMAEGKLYDIECPREVLRQMKGASE